MRGSLARVITSGGPAGAPSASAHQRCFSLFTDGSTTHTHLLSLPVLHSRAHPSHPAGPAAPVLPVQAAGRRRILSVARRARPHAHRATSKPLDRARGRGCGEGGGGDGGKGGRRVDGWAGERSYPCRPSGHRPPPASFPRNPPRRRPGRRQRAHRRGHYRLALSAFTAGDRGQTACQRRSERAGAQRAKAVQEARAEGGTRGGGGIIAGGED